MMSGPGDQRAAAQRPGQLRASHADREQAIEQLKAAFVDGSLTKDEFDLRVGQTLASRTHADLTSVTSDLQARPAGVGSAAARPPRPPRPPSSPSRTLAKAARRSGACLLVAFVIVGVLAMTTNGDGGPSAFLAFCSVVIAVIAASGFLGYGVVDAWQEHRSRAQSPPRPRRNGRRLEGGRHSSTGRDPASPGACPDQDQTRADLRTRRPGHASIWLTPVGRSYTAEPAGYLV